MSENSANNLFSASINQLINGFNGQKLCFVVPSYQRGYRWTDSQVERLLTDLYEFGTQKTGGNKLVGEFYCLQPIVVKKLTGDDVRKKLGNNYSIDSDTDYYEIVDGQQRMITVFILLKYILRDAEPYSIEFERDKDRKNVRHALLNSMDDRFNPATISANCADAHYFLETFKSISKWFVEYKNITKKNNLKSVMETILCDDTHVIWYELDSNADCYSIFKNINHGKIPLTDAELVKAMLLNSKNYASMWSVNAKIVKQEQDRYARLWDEIQKALSDDGMWSFITGGGNIEIPTNIDFIIRLIVKKSDPDYQDDSDYKYFSYFEKKLAKATNKTEYIEGVFEDLKTTFRTIQDWYNNYELHNYIGFVLTYGVQKGAGARIKIIIDLISKYEKLSKTQFVDGLKAAIKKMFDRFTMDDINYEENREAVEKLLMLFNIEELNEIHEKFNFSVNNDVWSIEHIKAQHSEITQAKDRRAYLQQEKDSLTELKGATGNEELKNAIDGILPEINKLLKQPKDIDIAEGDFKSVAELIDKQIDGFDEYDMHKLGNLALISKNDNSSLSNKPFYQKREQINKWLKDSSKNIPHSTRKAFLKMYSPQEYALDFTRWRKSDFNDMFNRQREMLKDFIKV